MKPKDEDKRLQRDRAFLALVLYQLKLGAALIAEDAYQIYLGFCLRNRIGTVVQAVYGMRLGAVRHDMFDVILEIRSVGEHQ